MNLLALNLLLAAVWALLQGNVTVGDLLIGFAVGLAAIALSQRVLGGERYLRAVVGVFLLLVSFAMDLVLSNLRLARDILRRSPPFHPSVIELDIRGLGRLESVILANLISLTPGTLTIDIRGDGAVISVHAVYAEDPADVRRRARRLTQLLRRAFGEAPLPAEEAR